MYAHILQFVADSPWAITEEKMASIRSFLSRKAAGENISAAEIAMIKRPVAEPTTLATEGFDVVQKPFAIECDCATACGNPHFGTSLLAAQGSNPSQSSRSRAGNVAVLPLYGTITPKANLMSEMSGGTSLDKFMGWFRAALADPSIRSIVLDVNSPGGSVYGVQEAADEIFKARGVKPITAFVSALSASAAYWLATQADEMILTPSGEVGSIGVFMAYADESESLKQQGVKVDIIRAGKFKNELSGVEPMSDEARANLQARANEYYDTFAKAVARGRGVTPTTVRDGFGQGRVVSASSALQQGMVDRVATMDATLSRLGVRSSVVKPAATATAEVVDPVITAEVKPETVKDENPVEAMKLRQRLLELQ